MSWWVDMLRPNRVIDSDGNLVAKVKDEKNTALIAASLDMADALRPFAVGKPEGITEENLIACEAAYKKAMGV